MALITTTTTSTTTPSPTCPGNRWILPVQDVACALPATGTYPSIMAKCCPPAAVTTYNAGCDLYCLAQGQSMGDLLACIQGNGGTTDVFCGGQLNATATASLTSTSTSTSTGTGTGTATATASKTSNAAVAGEKRVSVLGVGVVMLVVFGVVV